MQRAEALKGLSREHHEALVLARHASATATDPQGVLAKTLRIHLLERWVQQFEPHFALEEQTLLPALARSGYSEVADIALVEHTALRGLIERLRQNDTSALAQWGDAMAAHVRFEERTLFPLAQSAFESCALTEVMNPSASPSNPSHQRKLTMSQACNHTTAEAVYPFDARGVAKRFRHAAIFGALDSLTPGETMRFVNDHDPIPLLHQLEARYGAAIEINYVQREPGQIVIDFARI